jgi:Sulfotransferase family
MNIKKPIFILGTPRSGTTWLGAIMKQHPNIHLLHEINNVWMWGNANKSDDTLTKANLNPKIEKYIRQKFISHLEKDPRKRICDKTPRNCLRIRAIQAIFPDAKIIMLLRDGRAVINSTKKELKKPKGVPWKEIFRRLKNFSILEIGVILPRLESRFKRIMGIPLEYWGTRPPGWEKWIGKFPNHVILAKQWAATIDIAVSEGRELSSENYLEINYEELVVSPAQEIQKIAEFVELDNPQSMIDYAITTAKPSKTDKWKDNFDAEVLDDIRRIIEPTMTKLGYRW